MSGHVTLSAVLGEKYAVFFISLMSMKAHAWQVNHALSDAQNVRANKNIKTLSFNKLTSVFHVIDPQTTLTML